MCKWVAVQCASAARIPPAGERVLLVQMTVAEVMGVGILDLCGGKRGGPRAAFARQMAMYLCRLVFVMSFNEVALAFGRDRTTVRHAVRRVEDAREDPSIDRTLLMLEAALRRAGAHV